MLIDGPHDGSCSGAQLFDALVFPPAGLITAALGLASFSLAGLYCNHADLSPRYAPVLLGLTNTSGAIPGIVGVVISGETGHSFFKLCGACMKTVGPSACGTCCGLHDAAACASFCVCAMHS